MTTNEIWQSDLNELAGYVLAQEVGWLLAGCLTHTHYSFFSAVVVQWSHLYLGRYPPAVQALRLTICIC